MKFGEHAFNDADRDAVLDRYTSAFSRYGHSEMSLGWGKKGRQAMRFEVLLSGFALEGKSVLELGAGFGDLARFVFERGASSYTGIELTPALVAEGRRQFGGDSRFSLVEGDVSAVKEFPGCDVVIISGLFNFKLQNRKNYAFIEQTLTKALTCCEVGVATNFVTDRVDYHDDLVFYASPERILEMAYRSTRRVVLRSDYMPFEFSVFLYRNDAFDPSTAVFGSPLR